MFRIYACLLYSGVWPLACWDYGFESRRGHRCLCVVNIVCCAGKGLCDELISRPGESYRECVCLCVIQCATITLYTYRTMSR